MGYIRHDAIVVTSWNEGALSKVRDKAEELELPVSDIVRSPVNGYRSFLIAPDGSKEGWDDSDAGDSARETWKQWVREQCRYEDGSSSIDYVHLSYAGDAHDDTRIVDSQP